MHLQSAGTAAVETDLDLVVVGRTRVAEDVVALTLRPRGGGLLPRWSPGAHIDLILSDLEPDARVRQYSLCGDPGDRGEWRIAVLREGAGTATSAVVHDRLRPGDPVRARGPRNHFPLEPSPAYLFIAGGIGITPLLSMLAAAQRAGADWELAYCGRSRASMVGIDDLTAAYGERVRIHPRDSAGPLDLAVLLRPRPGALVYCCGPERLIAGVEDACSGWPAGSLHVERFTARPVGEPVRTDTFQVVLRDSGLALDIPPNRSVLSVVEEAGISVLTSCGEGTCGTCEVAVLDGIPDHRDSVLTATERAANDCMMICVSRARTPRLVLEL